MSRDPRQTAASHFIGFSEAQFLENREVPGGPCRKNSQDSQEGRPPPPRGSEAMPE